MDAQQNIKHWSCEECEAIRIPIESGWVCPNGHGRIHSDGPKDLIEANELLVHKDLPRCKRVSRREYRTDEGVLISWRAKGEWHSVVDAGNKLKKVRLSERKTKK